MRPSHRHNRDDVAEVAVRSGKARLLWIDDEISLSNPAVALLRSNGFFVECARTGGSGIALAQSNQYHCILLDLRLPDLPGLALLAGLRAHQVVTPVLVVTGFGDFEAARVAGQLGAAGFKEKPIFIDELIPSIERVVQNSEIPPAIPDDLSVPSFRSLAALFESVHRRTQYTQHDAGCFDRGVTSRRTLIDALMRGLLDRDLPMPAFMGCARAFRFMSMADPAESPALLADHAETLILETMGKPRPKDARVITTLRMLESAAVERKRITAKEIAKTKGIADSHLGRLVSAETGFDFTEWRTAFLLRLSLSALANSNEHIKQIACGVLGFSHEPQFDHEFRRFFGVTPTCFRLLSRNSSLL